MDKSERPITLRRLKETSDRVELEVPDLAAAMRVLEAWGHKDVEISQAKPRRGIPADQADAAAKSLLEAISEHPDGIDSSGLATALGLANTKALARTIFGVRRRLEELGFDLDQAAVRSRERNTGVWRPGPKAEEILCALGDEKP